MRLLDCRHHYLNSLDIGRMDDEEDIRKFAVPENQIPDSMVDDQWKARSIKE